MSHTITLHKPLRVRQAAPNRFAASGSPVDCVYLGVMRLCPRLPALVVSGINDGFNLGNDVFYSGTVGAAIEGGLRGSQAIAVSVEHGAPECVERAVELTLGIGRALLERPLARGTVLNINVPTGDERRYRMTRLGRRLYRDDVQERSDPRGRAYYWIGGGEAGMEELAGSDCEAVQAGIISVTPLHLDLTAEAMLGEGAPEWPPEIVGGFQRAP